MLLSSTCETTYIHVKIINKRLNKVLKTGFIIIKRQLPCKASKLSTDILRNNGNKDVRF